MTRSALNLLALCALAALLLPACPAPAPADDDASDDDDATADDDDATEAPFTCEGIMPEVTELWPDDLAAMLEDKDFELINVHVPYAGEIAGTDVHIAFTDVDAIEAHLGGDVTARAVLYCLTGPMSAQATAALVDRGYCRIFDLTPGMIGWEQAGYTIDP